MKAVHDKLIVFTCFTVTATTLIAVGAIAGQGKLNLPETTMKVFLGLAVLLGVFLYLYTQMKAGRVAVETLREENKCIEQHCRRQSSLSDIKLSINLPVELSSSLRRVCEVVTQFLPATGASVVLWDTVTEQFAVSASTVPGQTDQLAQQRVRRTGGATRWIVDHKRPLIVRDVREDPFGANSMLSEFGMRAYAGFPLLADGEAIGVLYAIDCDAREYCSGDCEFLTAVANSAAVAISKVQLYEKLQCANQLLEEHAEHLESRVIERTAELAETNQRLRQEIEEHRRDEAALRKSEERYRRLSGCLLALQDQERRHIARELHDTTAQNLGVVTLNLARLSQPKPAIDGSSLTVVTESLALAEQCLREIRTLSYLLHPPLLDESGLTSALSWYVDGFTKRSGIPVRLDVAPGVERLPAYFETALFRVVQESLTNIHRHSGCRRASIHVSRAVDQVTLEIQDDGRGMSLQRTGADSGNPENLGVGIMGMRERLRQLGGCMELQSNDRGTTLRAVLRLGTNGR